MVPRLIKDAAHQTQTLMRSGVDQHDAWNQTAVVHLQAAKVRCLSAVWGLFCFPGRPPCYENSSSHPYPPLLLRDCLHLTSKAVVQRILIKGLNSKASCWQPLGKSNEALLLDLIQVIQIAPPREKSSSSLPLAPQAILGCLIQFTFSFVFVRASPPADKYLTIHSSPALDTKQQRRHPQTTIIGEA